MATRNSNTNAQKSTGRRPGRPSNASKVAAVQSQQSMLIDVAIAAASAAVKSAFGIAEGGVTTIGTGIAQPQGSQSTSAGSQSGTQSGSQPQGRSTRSTSSGAKKAPGRKVQADSNMSKTRAFYDENLKAATPLNRAEFVREVASRFACSPATANTYVSNIEKEGGYKLVSRSNNGKGTRTRRTSAKRSTAQSTQTAAAA